MSNVSKELHKIRQPPRRRFAKWFIAASLCIVCLVTLIRAAALSGPTYNGKQVRYWFEEAVKLEPGRDKDAACSKAFLELDGDAIPFLQSWVNAKSSRFDKPYSWFIAQMPDKLSGRLPAAKTYAYYQSRRMCAMSLLAEIGWQQRSVIREGASVSKCSITSAVPDLQIAMRDTDAVVRGQTFLALSDIGPNALVALPDLLKVANDPNDAASDFAIASIGSIGASASNAVPTLVRIAVDGKDDRQLFAVQSLGQIGPPAASAIPALTGMLGKYDSTATPPTADAEKLRDMIVRAMRSIDPKPL